MKSFNQYLAESEYRQNHPVKGDDFAFELEDGTLLESYILDTDGEHILVDTNTKIFEELSKWYRIEDILKEDSVSSNEVLLEMGFGSLSYGESKDSDCEVCGMDPCECDHEHTNEAEYQGRNVPLGKPMKGDVKKFKVYVRDPKTGNVKKVNFGHGGKSAKRAGQKTMRIKKSNPARRRSFRARHNCENPGPRTKARYWSCRAW